ncbi:MAG: asparaginase [Alphaproteobacteria bacterium]|nr:asparaginase [Alphaproteobacteria bacterium]MBR1756483.1 asparaginase [Alphaproteobacteria bacterium]
MKVQKSSKEHLHDLFTNPWYKVLFDTFSAIISYTHEFYKQKGLSPILFPITTGSISSPMGEGSDSLPVQIEIKGNKVFLADSMQFSLEVGTRLAEKGCYYIMPSFRGEEVDERHLNEFFHSEAEIRGNLDDVMQLVTEYILFLADNFLKNNQKELKMFTDTSHIAELVKYPTRHFSKITYAEALKMLSGIEKAINIDEYGNKIITKYGEKSLIAKYGEFCWLTELPAKIVPFYQASKEDDAQIAKAADLLAGIGEVVGCGERCEKADELYNSLQYHNIPIDGYQWYYDMKKLFPIQTAGFGMGIERFILWLLNHDDIRDCMLLIRNHRQINFP